MNDRKPLVSVITPVLNAEKTIRDTITSVLSQTYANIEYIIVDNGSTDGSLGIINEYKNKISLVLHEDVKGIYTAMNKGLSAAGGEIIVTLNADDFFIGRHCVEVAVDKMENVGADILWGDVLRVNRDRPEEVLGYIKSSDFSFKKFERGWMPPHAGFLVRKALYKKYGYFNTAFKIAADYELMLRFLYKNKVKSVYLPEVLVKFREGGLSRSSVLSIIKNNIDCYRAWKINGLRPNIFMPLLKPLSKIDQFLNLCKVKRQ